MSPGFVLVDKAAKGQEGRGQEQGDKRIFNQRSKWHETGQKKWNRPKREELPRAREIGGEGADKRTVN